MSSRQLSVSQPRRTANTMIHWITLEEDVIDDKLITKVIFRSGHITAFVGFLVRNAEQATSSSQTQWAFYDALY